MGSTEVIQTGPEMKEAVDSLLNRMEIAFETRRGPFLGVVKSIEQGDELGHFCILFKTEGELHYIYYDSKERKGVINHCAKPGEQSDKSCPTCGALLKPSYSYCPGCGKRKWP